MRRRARPTASTRSTSCAGSASRSIAHHERVAQRASAARRGRRAGGQQLLGEQRVALAARVQALDELGVRARRRGCRRAGRRARRASGARARRARVRSALELGQQRPQRMAAVQLVGAVGRDDEQPLGRTGCAPGRRGSRGSSGRPSGCPRARAASGRVAAEAVQQRRAAPRRAAAGPLPRRRRGAVGLAAELGQQRGELGARAGQLVERRVAVARERAQRADERRVGQLALAELDAVAEQDTRAAVARARASSSTSRVLPTPDSPATKASHARPSAAWPRTRRSSASCGSRPTNRRLETRDATPAACHATTVKRERGARGGGRAAGRRGADGGGDGAEARGGPGRAQPRPAGPSRERW